MCTVYVKLMGTDLCSNNATVMAGCVSRLHIKVLALS